MVFLLILVIAALVARARGGDDFVASVERYASGRGAPVLVGLLWGGVIWWSWGRLQPAPIYHDELAYVFQSTLFASGRWTAPSPPLADFFAQPHLLVSPVMASKYPPGHSLLLSLGHWVGSPGIMVVLLAALRGAMAFILARRMANGSIALVTCVFMLHGDSLQFGASYFSETTTGALLLVAWYAMLRWHDEGGAAWMATLALALGWCAITRPFSAVLFALPIGLCVVWRTVRMGRWRDLVLGIVLGSVVVAILPLWSARTTGDWRLWPATVYTRDYMPFDRPHFGVDSTPPRRELPPDLTALIPSLRAAEREHTVDRLGQIGIARAAYLAVVTWWAPVPGALLALTGLLTLPLAAWVAVATVATLFLGYLAHPTWANWTIYNMETEPVLAFLAVSGLGVVLRLVAREHWRERLGTRAPRASRALLVAGLLCIALVQREVRGARAARRANYSYLETFQAAVRQLPPRPAILFVRHAPGHSPHVSLITNGPNWTTARAWIVADRGDARNAELLRKAPDRHGYLFRESASRIDPYTPTGAR